MRSRWLLTSLALLAGGLQAWASTRLDSSRDILVSPPQPEVPSIPAAIIHGLLRPRLAADIQLARATSYAGDGRFTQGRPALGPLVRLVVSLDPSNQVAYRVGGLLLASEPNGEREAVDILSEGARLFPDSYSLPFFTGCLQLTALADPAGAAASWREAARRPGAPPFLQALVSRLRGMSGRCVAALVAVTELKRHAPPSGTAVLEARQKNLRVECALLEMEDAVTAYRAQHGRAPARLEDLVGPNLLPRIPPEPLGGTWILEAGGNLRSTSGLPRVDLGRQEENATP
jgi:hypothetical protein